MLPPHDLIGRSPPTLLAASNRASRSLLSDSHRSLHTIRGAKTSNRQQVDGKPSRSEIILVRGNDERTDFGGIGRDGRNVFVYRKRGGSYRCANFFTDRIERGSRTGERAAS